MRTAEIEEKVRFATATANRALATSDDAKKYIAWANGIAAPAYALSVRFGSTLAAYRARFHRNN